ncbi:MAG: glycosyltransferase [Terriglobales bacterium]
MAHLIQADPSLTTATEPASEGMPVRVLSVIPAGLSKASMIFARRQVASLQRVGVVCETFLLASRTSPPVLASEWKRLRRAIRSFRPDVLHSHYGTVTALLTALSTSIPLVVTYRGSDLNPDPSVSCVLWSARRLLSELAALRAASIICVSAQLRDRLWWRKSRALVIPTGVDTEVFYPRPRTEARIQLGWGQDERVVLFNAGGHPSIKRLDLAQAAVDVARKLTGDIRFAVLNGDFAPEIIPLMMNAADCLLVTSDWEGSPTVVQEAMACNLPVVTVDVGDVRARLAEVSPTHIVERNPAEIGKAVADILNRGERSNGSTRIGEVSNAAIAEQLVSIYCALRRRANPQPRISSAFQSRAHG